MSTSGNVMFIEHIVVHPDWRNRGLGSVLFHLLMRGRKMRMAAGLCHPAGGPVLRAGRLHRSLAGADLMLPTKRLKDIRTLSLNQHRFPDQCYRQRMGRSPSVTKSRPW